MERQRSKGLHKITINILAEGTSTESYSQNTGSYAAIQKTRLSSSCYSASYINVCEVTEQANEIS